MTINDIQPGLPVFAPDGERVGRVTALLNDAFELERGLFHGHMAIPLAAIETLQTDGIYLRVPLAHVDTLNSIQQET